MEAKERIYKLLYQALLEIDEEAYATKNNKISQLAALFDGVPLRLWRAAEGEGTYDEILSAIQGRSQWKTEELAAKWLTDTTSTGLWPTPEERAFVDTVSAWLKIDGVVLTLVHVTRTGSAASVQLLTSHASLLDVVEVYSKRNSRFRRRDRIVVAYRQPKFLLHGIADARLLERAKELVPEGADWMLFYKPSTGWAWPFDFEGTGDRTHEELHAAFQETQGTEVYFGLDAHFPPESPVAAIQF